MYDLIGLEQIQPLAEIQWKVSNTYRTITQAWGDIRPKLIDFGIRAIGVGLVAITLTVYAGVTCRRGFDWLYPRLKAAYRAFRDYQEKPIRVIRFEEEIDFADWMSEPEFTLPDPADYFGGEAMPEAETFEEYAAIREQEALTVDNSPLESAEQEFDRWMAEPLTEQEREIMDDFDPIPTVEPDELPTVPDLRAVAEREMGFVPQTEEDCELVKPSCDGQEVTPTDVKVERRRGRPRKAKSND